ncbi:MAG: aldo/keto reductase [Beijerinckiaceae bacterium]|jgi:aryl-alcohol dehydrogenase-like predicted oxidoreductase|nr:aldo/keto reductase [Beijerinckiaceae bacterium]MDO9441635.1 aldo/keto reductase [Beijerinckiaceae bacterium]
MMREFKSLSRRDALALASATAASSLMPALPAFAQATPLLARKIPSSGEMLPCVGIGTAIIFDFENDKAKFDERAEVLKTLVAGGGRLVDTAPSYGKAEDRLGELFAATGLRDKIFLATKVRVAPQADTIAEMKGALARLKTDKVELMQLHNVRDPNQSLALLRDWKSAGTCKYLGITSSFDRDYDAVEACLKKEKPDFFQIDYSMVDRNSEDRLIPAAADAGCAILTNLPFGRGKFFQKTAGKPLPDFAKEIDCTSWAQYALKWLLGHPAITAVIPGTDRAQYMVDNLKAAQGRLPDAAMRKRMLDTLEAL